MTCQAVQNQLLIAEDLDLPPADVAVHLHDCSICRQWLHQLLQMERAVPLLPVPPTTTRAEFLRRFLAAPSPRPKSARTPKPEVPSPTTYRLPIPRYRWYAAGAVAAALMLLALDGLLLHPNPEPPAVARRPAADPFLNKLFQCDLNLAQADTPRARIEALEALAEGLHDHTLKLLWQANPRDLLELAELYQQVVGEGLVAGARHLPADQRQQVLQPLAERLRRTGQETETLVQNGPLPKDRETAQAMRLVAEAARNASKEVLALMENQKS